MRWDCIKTSCCELQLIFYSSRMKDTWSTSLPHGAMYVAFTTSDVAVSSVGKNIYPLRVPLYLFLF